MLKGIDISNHQAGLDLSKVDCDFVIIKATEGKSYVDNCCDGFFQSDIYGLFRNRAGAGKVKTLRRLQSQPLCGKR